jgi:hypothetical protein
VRAHGACVAIALACACTRRDGAPSIAKDPAPLDAVVADVAPPLKPAEISVSAVLICMTGVCAVNVETRNDGDVEVQLDDELVAERAEDGGFSRVIEQYVSIGQCDPDLEKYGPKSGRPCKTLAAHSTLKAAPWYGMTCSSQCVMTCRANAMHAKGSYRFVVHACGDATRVFASHTIEWPFP